MARLQETGEAKITKVVKKFELSIGEKDLAKEVKRIKHTQAFRLEEESKKNITHFGWEKFKDTAAPLANKVKVNSQAFGLCPEDRISEWEKNEVKKLFWNYDKDKSGYLDFEEMAVLLKDIKENKAGIGKIPVDDIGSIIEVIKAFDRNNDSKIHWREFRDGMNAFKWRLCDADFLEQEIKNLYARAKKEEMNGRTDSAKQLAMQALRLQGLDTRTKMITPKAFTAPKQKFRTDTYFAYHFKESLRDVGAKTIYNSSKPLQLLTQPIFL